MLTRDQCPEQLDEEFQVFVPPSMHFSAVFNAPNKNQDDKNQNHTIQFPYFMTYHISFKELQYVITCKEIIMLFNSL